MVGEGRLKFRCVYGDTLQPVNRAKIKVSQIDKMGNYATNYDNIYSDSVGLTDELLLETPSKSASDDPKLIPYYTYNVEVNKPGYRPLIIIGIQVFPQTVAIQRCELTYDPTGMMDPEVIKIPPHRQVGDYPNKIPEAPIKTESGSGTFSILDVVSVPDSIIVHAGVPNNNSAPNYTVNFRDYIKNVASSELYPTWTESTLRANINCIVSFTLNRIYTEWYIGKGKDFNITNSTAFDQSFNYGRNITTNINAIVDELFDNYIQLGNQVQPLLAQYCNGTTVACPGWLSQWGSQYLGQQGYSPYEILKKYYGDTVNIKSAQQIQGQPISYPGEPLALGSKGPNVSKKQNQLNEISKNYPLIKNIPADGVYGDLTMEAVKAYQKIFNIPVTGIIDKATWYSLSNVYSAVKKFAELVVPRCGYDDFVFSPPVLGDIYKNVPRIKW